MANIQEVYNFRCKVFSPDTADLSAKELKKLLKELYSYYPYTDKGNGNREPFCSDSSYSKGWFLCYDHLLMLLEQRQQEFKHNLSIWFSIIAIVVSISGVVVRVAIPI